MHAVKHRTPLLGTDTNKLIRRVALAPVALIAWAISGCHVNGNSLSADRPSELCFNFDFYDPSSLRGRQS
jgi:hypothetical protein